MKKYINLTASHLKILAVLSMAVDHFGDVFLDSGTPLYIACRIFGRLAFPLFCFLLTEGFRYTKSREKYFLRLIAFAAISEIPYNLAFDKTVLEKGSLNVFFTLALGFAAMWAVESVKNKILGISTAFVCMVAAELLGTDYGWYGVAVILIFYLLRDRREIALFAFILLTLAHSLVGFWLLLAKAAKKAEMSPEALFRAYGYRFIDIPLRFCRQIFAGFAAVPIILYNGKKGFLKLKYFFYVFYPAHLLAYYLLWRIFG
ncbi:MAG: conjugal transfer protein TraX [Clostridia bacterium]|nr:conjugal transfer protein TraX [Clostridia bacterium]